MGRKWQSFGNLATSLGLFLIIFLLLWQAKAENHKTCTPANQNLSPIEGWRSAECCLKNTSNSCPEKYWLDDLGWLNVTHDDGPSFCSNGCAEHTRAVLLCIAHAKRDYWFANGATIKDLNDTIYHGCNSPQGFNGTSFYSVGYRLNSVTPIFIALSAAVLLAFF